MYWCFQEVAVPAGDPLGLLLVVLCISPHQPGSRPHGEMNEGGNLPEAILMISKSD